MTENEWLRCEEPGPMLRFVENKLSERKLRLFTIACCERVKHLFIDTRCHSALACARRYADGRADHAELSSAASEALGVWRAAVQKAGVTTHGEAFGRMTRMLSTGIGLVDQVAAYDQTACAAAAVQCVTSPELKAPAGIEGSRYAARAVLLERGSEEWPHERSTQIVLAWDIFGNPFRPVAFDSRWRTDTTLSLARQMYESRDFSAMPILADALQDAGCDNTDILNHCRDASAPHVRGCWVVDSVLEKN